MTFFETFFAEKNLSEKTYTVTSAKGTANIIPSTTVIDAIKRTKGDEAKQIENILRQLDFANGNIHHFLQHIAQGLAVDMDF
tara:strand:+ start:1120 stop:1365 length:246 start_codon:yes stop_codon:yes gene_type:complete